MNIDLKKLREKMIASGVSEESFREIMTGVIELDFHGMSARDRINDTEISNKKREIADLHKHIYDLDDYVLTLKKELKENETIFEKIRVQRQEANARVESLAKALVRREADINRIAGQVEHHIMNLNTVEALVDSVTAKTSKPRMWDIIRNIKCLFENKER